LRKTCYFSIRLQFKLIPFANPLTFHWYPIIVRVILIILSVKILDDNNLLSAVDYFNLMLVKVRETVSNF